MRLSVRVPATAANVGPGFDCFGLALDLCNEVAIDTDVEPSISWEGEGADELPTDGTDLVSRAIASAVERQRRHHPDVLVPRFALRGVNRIPLERGLGSSSAAVVAGTALADVLLGPAGWERERSTTFGYAAELEGHPDNAAPAVYGGLTVVADGVVRSIEVHPDIAPVLLVPDDLRLPTSQARAALPTRVPVADAVFNVAHGALAVTALSTGDLDLLFVGLRDRLHEDVRLSMAPAARDLLDDLRQAQVPACVSGAGPALLAFDHERHPVPPPEAGWRLLRVPVRTTGVEILGG